MPKLLPPAAFAAGLAVIGWVGAGYLTSNPLALGVTLCIGAFYAMGALDLHRFRQATAGLRDALAAAVAPPADLAAWLEQVPAALRTPVRLRVEGDRVALPGPALAPSLAGLLVLLGMLGTFLGMVVTLDGTGGALERAADLASIRAALTAPVKGLGLAFGTSVAGVAGSAMLGLMTALARRERLQAAQALDARCATVLRPFSQAHQREETFRLVQQQTALMQQMVQQMMPPLVERLQATMDAVAQQGRTAHEQLLERQQRFQSHAEGAYTALAASVDRSLKDSLADAARATGAALQPVAEATMAGIAREAAALHGGVARAVQQQLDVLAERFVSDLEQRSATLVDTLARRLEHTADRLEAGWQAAFEQQRHAQQQGADATAQALARAGAALEAQTATRDAQRLAAWTASASAMTTALADTAREITAHAEAQARGTIAEIGRLVEAAAEAPRAATEVIGALQRQLADGMARDNALLDERARLLETLATLLEAVNHTAAQQRSAVDGLVTTAADLLAQAGRRFDEQAQAHTETLQAAAAQVNSGAVEVASLGDALGFAVQRFGASNDQLVAQLQRIEAALGQSLERSDEQLAYYVAQAREIIDLCVASQKRVVDDLQRLARDTA